MKNVTEQVARLKESGKRVLGDDFLFDFLPSQKQYEVLCSQVTIADWINVLAIEVDRRNDDELDELLRLRAIAIFHHIRMLADDYIMLLEENRKPKLKG